MEKNTLLEISTLTIPVINYKRNIQRLMLMATKDKNNNHGKYTIQKLTQNYLFTTKTPR